MKDFSIITRTKNRTIMLERLFYNLCEQKYRAFEWIIVNDGGEEIDVLDIEKKAKSCGIDVVLIHNGGSLGRSYSANIGVSHSIGKYILILDDDDFISIDFLQKANDFFIHNKDFGAVTCYSQIVNEKIVEGKIINCGNGNVYKPSTSDLSIIGLHIHNIPTCGLIIRRELFIRAGGYPEFISCTEDWAFATKLIQLTNIGILSEVLAFISKRIAPESFYKNTTSDKAGIDTHLLDELVWKNNRVREELNNNQIRALLPILGFIALQNQEISRQFILLNSILQKIYRFTGAKTIAMAYRKVKQYFK